MPEFLPRHIGAGGQDAERMLAAVGASSASSLLAAAMPAQIQDAEAPDGLPPAASEAEVLALLRELASRNTVRTSMIGLGYHDTITPSVIQRGVVENPAWYTAYTPYQPEISQGRLEALLNFQTVVADLTGLPVAGASMLDEASAAAEAMLLARRAVRAGGTRFAVDVRALPQTRAVLATRAEAVGIELVDIDVAVAPIDGALEDVFGLLVQYPAADGLVPEAETIRGWAELAHRGGAQVVLAADILALTVLASPASLGADIAVGSTQRFGVPMGFGGPHAGYLAVREGLQRQLPGRLVGLSRDRDGAPALRLALQTREQHIRREKATSNICTAQVLLAVVASMYAVYHGPRGLRAIGERVHHRARTLAAALGARGADIDHERYFDTVAVRVPGHAEALREAALAGGVTIWAPSPDVATIACDEVTDLAALDAVLRAWDDVAGTRGPNAAEAAEGVPSGEDPLLSDLRREVDYLTHPVFSAHRSETAMMRYLRRLADRDYALDRGMIPLGSCTMKLNAATEMAAITWPGFARIHPFAPAEDVAGYLELIAGLERWLAVLTGYDSVSLQPNAGSQGELAGLLAIRGYHRANGEPERDVCLVPASAHGTNAASAVLAGLRVAVVASDASGNVDVDDLTRVLAAHAGRVAAIMVTYPSTHGVYEEGITTLCELVHAAGGQVYIDGANLNALVGAARPGAFGGDVSHLNLHKTFTIPHGGGGPGVGPVAVKAHLAPHLPSHQLDPVREHPDGRGGGPVAAAPHGSASILPISWAYIRLMGADGLRQATQAAVLAANYVADQLSERYPVLYRGAGGRVAHECILDLRPMTAATGVTAEDVAKRLIDYGFHAPTLSFPVAGTLMVEPTESEDVAELDRFCAAMNAIADEVDAVAEGVWPKRDNPLANAPHTAASLVAEWTHPYSRAQAVYPLPEVATDKYWPPVRRIDGAYGDRNLICACPPVESFA